MGERRKPKGVAALDLIVELVRCRRVSVGRLTAAIGLLAGLAAWAPASQAQTGDFSGDGTASPTFAGMAAAGGVRMTLTVPGAPGTDTALDGGGPTAQVVVDSIGSSTGYAAFPDPGQFIVSLPALAVGLLAGGAGGLPPTQLPSPPNYPFFVQSDATNDPEVSVGAGPYALSATSEPGSSQAQATAGVRDGLFGNAALAMSTASVSPKLTTQGTSVVAKAVADLQGLTVGPLTIGQVKSTAIQTLDSTGTVTPSTDLSITGVRIGGVPVELTPKGVVAGGPVQPVPLNDSVNGLLKSSGITVQFVAAQQHPDRVVAPALQITFPFAMPFPIPNVGQFHGTATMIVGSATTQMSGVAAQAGAGLGEGEDVTVGTGTEASSDPLARDGADFGSELAGAAEESVDEPASPGADVGSTPAAGVALSWADIGSAPAAGVAFSGADPDAASADASGAASVNSPNSAGAGTAPALAISTGANRGAGGGPAALDIRSFYLVVVAGAIAALSAAQALRWLGGRIYES